jgi:hypothetical protein
MGVENNIKTKKRFFYFPILISPFPHFASILISHFPVSCFRQFIGVDGLEPPPFIEETER